MVALPLFPDLFVFLSTWLLWISGQNFSVALHNAVGCRFVLCVCPALFACLSTRIAILLSRSVLFCTVVQGGWRSTRSPDSRSAGPSRRSPVCCVTVFLLSELRRLRLSCCFCVRRLVDESLVRSEKSVPVAGGRPSVLVRSVSGDVNATADHAAGTHATALIKSRSGATGRPLEPIAERTEGKRAEGKRRDRDRDRDTEDETETEGDTGKGGSKQPRQSLSLPLPKELQKHTTTTHPHKLDFNSPGEGPVHVSPLRGALSVQDDSVYGAFFRSVRHFGYKDCLGSCFSCVVG